jgi:hypothetical protein
MFSPIRMAMAAVAAVVLSVTLSTPAQAAVTVMYRNGNNGGQCVSYQSSDTVTRAIMDSCTYTSHLEVISRGTLNGHQLVQLKVVQLSNWFDIDHCLDSGTSAGGATAWVKKCNPNVWQEWEVFEIGNERVFKSFGFWNDRGQHVCLERPNGNTNALTMDTCTSRGDQQFTRVAVS